MQDSNINEKSGGMGSFRDINQELILDMFNLRTL